SELTQPPRLHGEITYIGTRGPNPHGRVVPLMVSSSFRYRRPGSEKYSPSSGTVDLPISLPSASYDGTAGGGRWSNSPSFSSTVMKYTVLLHTSGWAVSASSTREMESAPCEVLPPPLGCSDTAGQGSTQETCGRVLLRTSSVRSSRL